MLIPRFSLRATLMGFSVCSVFFVIVGYAVRGEAWAVIPAVAVLSIFATLAFHGFFYALLSLFGRIVGAEITPARTSQGGIQSSSNELDSVKADGTR